MSDRAASPSLKDEHLAELNGFLTSVELPPFLRTPLVGLANALAAGQGAGAAWFLKDAVEALAKTCHAALVSRALEQADQPSLDDAARATLRELARRLLERKPGAGTFVHELEAVVDHPVLLGLDGGLARRLAARLKERPNGGRTALIVMRELVDWRNRYSGHGALGDDARALSEAAVQLPALLRLIATLRPLLGELSVDRVPSAWGDVRLRPLLERSTVRHANVERPERPQVLEWIERERRQRVHFRDAETGDVGHRERVDLGWPELGRIEALAWPAKVGEVPAAAQRGGDQAFAAGWLQHLDSLRFAGFTAKSYMKPEYLIERVERAFDAASAGWLRLVGPGGVGKSFLCRGLCERWRGSEANPVLVLPVFVLPGDGRSGMAFRSALEGALHDEVARLRTRGVLLNRPSDALKESRAGLEEWLRVLAESNPRLERIVLVFDGMDELEPPAGTPALTALLPTTLPPRVFGLVSGRPERELDPPVTRDLAGLSWLGEVSIDPTSDENHVLLKSWLRRTTPSISDVDLLIERAGGRFLYVDHFARWTQRLGVTPTSAEFYPEVLRWLRGRVAATPQRYREALDRILRLLACVREAVPLEVLVAGGVAPEHVTEALIDLRDLLAREVAGPDDLRGRAEPYVYRIFHRELLDHLRQDPSEAAGLRSTEAAWAQTLLAHLGDSWSAATPDDPVDVYAVSHVAGHLATSGLEVTGERLVSVEAGDGALAKRANVLFDEQRFVAARRWARGALGFMRWAGVPPEGRDWLLTVGDVAERLVDLVAAETAYREFLALSQRAFDSGEDPAALSDLGFTRDRLGRVAEARGDLVAAESSFRDSLDYYLRALEFDETTHILYRLAVAWDRLGKIAETRGDLNAAEDAYRESLALNERVLAAGETSVANASIGIAWSRLSGIATTRGDLDAAESALRASLPFSGRVLQIDGPTPAALRDLSVTWNHIGTIAQTRGDLVGALTAFREAVRLSQLVLEAGETPVALRDLGSAWIRVGAVAQTCGDLVTAHAAFRAALPTLRRVSDTTETPAAMLELSHVLWGLGGIAESNGNLIEAQAAAQEALALSQRVLELLGTPPALLNHSTNWSLLGEIAVAGGDLVKAEAAFHECLTLARCALEAGETPAVLLQLGRAWNGLGAVQFARGELSSAGDAFRSALTASRGALDAGETLIALQQTCEAWNGLAAIAERQGDLLTAEANLGRALAFRRQMLGLTETLPALRCLGRDLLTMGALLAMRGDRQSAEAAIREGSFQLQRVLEASPTPEARQDVANATSCLRRLVNVSNNEQPPAKKPGRNDRCWCGSGKKFKHCHLDKTS